MTKDCTRHTDTRLDPDRPPSVTTCLGEFTHFGNVFGTSTLGTAYCSSGKLVKLTALEEFGQIMQPVSSLKISFQNMNSYFSATKLNNNLICSGDTPVYGDVSFSFKAKLQIFQIR